MQYRGGRERDNSGFEETVVRVNRVAKVVKGGKRFSFSALVVVGDRKGKVGFAIGKAGEVPEAIRKARRAGEEESVTVPMVEKTIPHTVRHEIGAATVLLKPAAPGTGVIAGGSMRAVLELAGHPRHPDQVLGNDQSDQRRDGDGRGAGFAQDRRAGCGAARQDRQGNLRRLILPSG